MEILQAMKRRCSVRRYEPRAVEREKLLYVLEAAGESPPRPVTISRGGSWSFKTVGSSAGSLPNG